MNPSDPIDQYGSHVYDGPRYSVLMARGPVFGPTYHRQLLAGSRGAVCHIEGHLNASPNKRANYCEAIVASNAGALTYTLGHAILNEISSCFAVPKAAPGVRVGHGQALVRRVHPPALVLEPGFVSNPDFARALFGEDIDALNMPGEVLDALGENARGFSALGRCIADAIADVFPNGGIVALSTGHAYRSLGKSLTQGDPGAIVTGEADPPKAFDTEAELVDAYLLAAAKALVEKP